MACIAFGDRFLVKPLGTLLAVLRSRLRGKLPTSAGIGRQSRGLTHRYQRESANFKAKLDKNSSIVACEINLEI